MHVVSLITQPFPFLFRLLWGTFMRNRGWLWHMRSYHSGVHSGFPHCCIFWYFVRVWLGIPEFIVSDRRIYWFWHHVIMWKDQPEEHQYVRCPVCILRRRYVEMHICNWKCGVNPTP